MMKRHFGSRFSTLRGGLAAASVLALALTGCGGGGGGNNSSSGTSPSPATSGVLIEGDPGSAITLPSDPTAIVGKNAVLDMSQTASFENGKLTVHFFLKDEDGYGISLTENSCYFRALASKLTDNTSDLDPGPGWHQVDTDSPSGGGLETLTGLLTVINGITGEYRYTFADDGASGRHEYAGGGIAAARLANDKLRATLVISCSVEINGEDYVTVNPVNGSYDFSAGNPGLELADSGAEIVSSAACFTCHGPTLAGLNDAGLETDHGRYTEVETCNQCHALNSYVGDENADLAPFIHSIHMGLPSQANGGGTYQTSHDWSGADEYGPVEFPQNIWKCAKCHADGNVVDTDHPDGKNGPVAAHAALAYSNPTRRACGSCHWKVDFMTGTNHGENDIGGKQTSDEGCRYCHTESGSSIGGSVRDVHDLGPTGPNPEDQSEFDVNISMTKPANGQYYKAGDTPIVTVTLKDHATGADVAPSVYTSPKDSVVGGGLSTATLYVYGPRSYAVPVLTTCSTTDPAFTAVPKTGACASATTATQGHNLFAGSTVNGTVDGNVIAPDANGFHYQLMDVDGLTAGTYMVRFEGRDATHAPATYQTGSSGVINFQVGTATEEPKVSGNGCLNCHGDTVMHLTGNYSHHQPFDTDGCLGCHDYSGNHGDYIGNRVHAIHHETFSGDYSDRHWTEVSFPQQANNCSICHTNSAAAVPVWRSTEPLACGGCHGTDPDAVAAAKKYITDESITGNEADEIMAKAGKEAIAASHMLINMGVAGGDREDFFTYGSEPVPGCLACHDAGQPQDLYRLMGLAKFGIPSTTE